MASLLSVASASPRYLADQELSTAHAQRVSCRNDREASTVGKLYKRSGIQTRGSVLLEERTPGTLTQSFYEALDAEGHGPSTRTRNDRFAIEASPLVCEAASTAIRLADCQPAQVSHLITVTCTGFHSPGIDIELIERLRLPRTTERVQIGFMGCHALINAFRTARGLAAADPDACILIGSVELCSLHYQYGFDAQKIVSGSLFADGAAAAIVAGRNFTSGRGLDGGAEITATGSCLIPNSRDAMSWLIGDHGFEMTLRSSVPGLIESNLSKYLKNWLADRDLSVGSIGGWAVHPGGIRILDAVRKSLDLPAEKLRVSREILRRHGNMSSATLGFVLEEFIGNKIPRPWLMLGFGPGLEIEVGLIR